MTRLGTDRRAIAAIEFALVMPVLAFMLLASVDLVTWLRSWSGAERAATSVADLIARQKQVIAADFQGPTGYFATANDIAQPLTVSGSGGATIVSCIMPSAGLPKVAWQYSGTANGAYTSKFGAAGSTAVLPNGLSLASNETIIVTEIYSGVRPWILSAKLWAVSGAAASGPTSIYTYALVRPRSAQLC